VKDTKLSPRPRVDPERESADPPLALARRWAARSWWLPWVLAAAVVGVTTVMIVQVTGGSSGQTDLNDVHLSTTKHHVVYEVTGSGKSPELKYVIDGVNGTETVNDANLPWHKEFDLQVGPGLGVVQVMATNNGTADTISCSVRVDGNVVHQTTATGQRASVACSSVIRPPAA
jgi:hypothetical protein